MALFRYAMRMTGDEEVAKDTVQHAFLRLIERRPEEANLRAWLYTVVTNAVRDWAREERRRRALLEQRPDQVPGPTPAPPPDHQLKVSAAETRVRRGLAALPERDRAILLLRAEGFKHREIADAIGTTTGSVGTMIARAVERLTPLLDLDGEVTS